MRKRLLEYPLYVFLVTIFFVFHGYVENAELLSPTLALIMAYQYVLVSIALMGIIYLLLKNINKAGLIIFAVLSFNFFFGPVHDWIKMLPQGFKFLSKYSVILPLALGVLGSLFYSLKRKKGNLKRVTMYLNLLFTVLIAIDIVVLVTGPSDADNRKAIVQQANDCPECPTPDIYLVIVDEYAGYQQLRDVFNFDNSPFLTKLANRGFHVVPRSISNYNFTHHSMASLLNLDYLPGIKIDEPGYKDMSSPLSAIRRSNVSKLLGNKGYRIFNYSIFNFGESPTLAQPTFLPSGLSILAGQTFLSRIHKDLEHNFIKWGMKGGHSSSIYTDRENNEYLFNKTWEIAGKTTAAPKFVYTHLMMPHYRYYYDGQGREVEETKVADDDYCKNKEGYIEYLEYANKKLLELVDHIKSNSAADPVILLMSDHGYRQFFDGDSAYSQPGYFFMNLNAVYLPDRSYSGFYGGLSNVNQFRMLFNTLFKTDFPVLKDSTTYIRH